MTDRYQPIQRGKRDWDEDVNDRLSSIGDDVDTVDDRTSGLSADGTELDIDSLTASDVMVVPVYETEEDLPDNPELGSIAFVAETGDIYYPVEENQ